ncbi:hypothetical protein D5085_00610 [Ectothiorhodospiraceae bacterium BW-2]|nr:hypothetical protein D5085_00610 [Ectothiorhodospiraceae bacterium BW-2]
MPFLSLLDNRAKPKGSRDPLGFELVWSHFGRKVIGNLTTITSSMDNFAVALLGFLWANQLVTVEEECERHKKIREIFLRYEQLTGYIRYLGKAQDIMGVTRVQKRILDESFKLTLGLGMEQQILSDQASYGLWGLYSTAARDTGLVEGNNRAVTPLGRSIADAIVKQLGEASEELYKLIGLNKTLDRGQLEQIAPTFMKAIHHQSVQQPLLNALMSGSDPHAIQNELWHITKQLYRDKGETIGETADFVSEVLKTKPSAELTQSLHEIMSIERILVAANNIFHYCRRKDGEHLDSIFKTLDGHYSYAYLPKNVPDTDFPRRDTLRSILEAFQHNDSRRVVSEVLSLNKSVMQQRSGAPWVELESGDTLRVKVKSEKAELRQQEELEQKWDYDYFIGSFVKIAHQNLGKA